MPHQCVKCGTFYGQANEEVLKGCPQCGGRLFFFVKKGKEQLLAEQRHVALSSFDRENVELDVYELIGQELDQHKPVVLDFESIRVASPGRYELDLVHLFQERRPVIYQLDEGKYVIDLPGAFEKLQDPKGEP